MSCAMAISALNSTHNKARPRRTEGRGARKRLMKWGPRGLRATREFHIAPTWMRKRAGDHRVGEPLARRHTQPLVIEERAFAALGGEKLVSDGIVDEPGNHRSFALEPDRDSKMWNPV